MRDVCAIPLKIYNILIQFPYTVQLLINTKKTSKPTLLTRYTKTYVTHHKIQTSVILHLTRKYYHIPKFQVVIIAMFMHIARIIYKILGCVALYKCSRAGGGWWAVGVGTYFNNN